MVIFCMKATPTSGEMGAVRTRLCQFIAGVNQRLWIFGRAKSTIPRTFKDTFERPPQSCGSLIPPCKDGMRRRWMGMTPSRSPDRVTIRNLSSYKL